MAVKENQAHKKMTGSVNQWLWLLFGQNIAAIYHVYVLYYSSLYSGPTSLFGSTFQQKKFVSRCITVGGLAEEQMLNLHSSSAGFVVLTTKMTVLKMASAENVAKITR